MDVSASIQALAAAMELSLVRSLRSAAGAAPAPAPAQRPNVAAPPRRDSLRIAPASGASVRLKAVIEPRLRIHPEPRIEPRQTVRPVTDAPPPATPPPGDAAQTPAPRAPSSPLEPPWKLLPWKCPPPGSPRLKQVVRPPDAHLRGSILDVFV